MTLEKRVLQESYADEEDIMSLFRLVTMVGISNTMSPRSYQ